MLFLKIKKPQIKDSEKDFYEYFQFKILKSLNCGLKF